MANESVDEDNKISNAHENLKRKSCESPSNAITKRNRVDRSIYINFMSFINNKVMPSKTEILNAYNKSPSLEKYSPKMLEDLIQKAINFDNIDFNTSQ